MMFHLEWQPFMVLFSSSLLALASTATERIANPTTLLDINGQTVNIFWCRSCCINLIFTKNSEYLSKIQPYNVSNSTLPCRVYMYMHFDMHALHLYFTTLSSFLTHIFTPILTVLIGRIAIKLKFPLRNDWNICSIKWNIDWNECEIWNWIEKTVSENKQQKKHIL